MVSVFACSILGFEQAFLNVEAIIPIFKSVFPPPCVSVSLFFCLFSSLCTFCKTSCQEVPCDRQIPCKRIDFVLMAHSRDQNHQRLPSLYDFFGISAIWTDSLSQFPAARNVSSLFTTCHEIYKSSSSFLTNIGVIEFYDVSVSLEVMTECECFLANTEVCRTCNVTNSHQMVSVLHSEQRRAKQRWRSWAD